MQGLAHFVQYGDPKNATLLNDDLLPLFPKRTIAGIV